MRWIESMQQEKSPAMSQKIGSTCLEITAAAAAAAAERHTRAFLERVASPWRSTSCFHMYVQAHLSLSLSKICTLIRCSWHCRGNASAPAGTHVFQAVSQACLFSQQPTGSWCSALSAHHHPSHASRALAQGEGGAVGSVGKWGGDRGGWVGEIQRECVCMRREARGMQISVNAAVFNGTVSFFSKRNLRHQF